MQDISKINQDITSLKATAEKKHQEKEGWFTKQQAIKIEIYKAIDDIKAIKRELDQAKTVQQQLRTERDTYNQKTKELIAQIKILQQQTKIPAKKASSYLDAGKIKRTIERLDTKIETEALPLDREKKVMEQIKKLKKLLKENEGILQLHQQHQQLSREIQEARKKADDFHHQFEAAKKREQENYEKFRALTQKINDLKKLHEEAFQHFKALKGEYGALAREVKGKFQEKRKSYQTAKQQRERQEKQRKQQQLKVLAAKTKSVEEKLKAKKKLTTEDLIAFQGTTERQQ